METASYKEVLQQTVHFPFNDLMVTPINEGLINRTYKVTIKANGYQFILQQINNEIFPEPEKLQENYYHIWSYLENGDVPAALPIRFSIPKPLRFEDMNYFFTDSRGKYWRQYELVPDAIAIHKPVSVAQAKKVAETFACLTASFDHYPIENIHTTIPGFHDLSLRYHQFRQALNLHNFERLANAASLINQLRKREGYVNFYEIIAESPEFEKRLMHHDAKISNILFEEDTGNIICPIDFDTCMPGYFFSDLGDLIRSMACSEDESGTGLKGLHIRKDYYEVIVDSYTNTIPWLFTEAEKKYIHYAGLLMIYMQALRFITDYLNGDRYYKIDYPEQNLDRARNQFILLERLEEFLKTNYQFKV